MKSINKKRLKKIKLKYKIKISELRSKMFAETYRANIAETRIIHLENKVDALKSEINDFNSLEVISTEELKNEPAQLALQID